MTDAQPHTLYRFFAGDVLVYVGITVDLGIRWRSHRSDKRWWTEVTRIEIEHFPDLASVRVAEKVAIIAERPKYNVVHAGTVRPPAVPRRHAVRRCPGCGVRSGAPCWGDCECPLCLDATGLCNAQGYLGGFGLLCDRTLGHDGEHGSADGPVGSWTTWRGGKRPKLSAEHAARVARRMGELEAWGLEAQQWDRPDELPGREQ